MTCLCVQDSHGFGFCPQSSRLLALGHALAAVTTRCQRNTQGQLSECTFVLLLLQVWDTPSIPMKLPFATPSRRASEAGSHVAGSDPEAPELPWGLVLSQFATVARHDPRREVCCADLT